MKKVTIVGMGMMGASFALALKGAGLAQFVVGVDMQPAVLETALQRGIIDSAAANIASGVGESDAVVLATPVCAVMKLLPVLDKLNYRGLIIDLGSTKQAICELAENLPDLQFVGCHPMAGSEMAGIDGVQRNLFVDAPVIITPAEHTKPALLDQAIDLWRNLGCRVTVMNPAEHDYTVALISHLPYLAAVVTMNTAAELARHHANIFTLIAGGFRDTTRVSEGDPVMWRDICLTNRTHILTAIAEFKVGLGNVEQALETGDADLLQDIFQTSQKQRRTYIPRKK